MTRRCSVTLVDSPTPPRAGRQLLVDRIPRAVPRQGSRKMLSYCDIHQVASTDLFMAHALAVLLRSEDTEDSRSAWHALAHLVTLR